MGQRNSQKNAQEVMPVNSKVKDTFFKTVYAAEKRQRELASFLLGVNVEKVTTANIRPVLFGNRENDLAFICDDVFYTMTECQAGISPNVPYRLLEYITAGLRATVDSEQLLYGSSRVYFPIPKLYVLQVGLERTEEKLPKQVMYDIRLSDSYVQSGERYEGKVTRTDLEVIAHTYDFRMTLDEILDYIEQGKLPERFAQYNNDMRNYALTANGITYIQRAMKHREHKKYKMPRNVLNVAEYLQLLMERDIFVDLLSDKEVCDMTMAQFSRDDMLMYQGREAEREDSIKNIAEIYHKFLQTSEAAKSEILDKYPDVDETLVDSIIAEVYDL